MADPALHAEVSALIYSEARLLDQHRWDDWLALYSEDAVFWVPAFRMDGTLTTDPATELNLIYLSGRAGLEERVFRLRTEIALSATPVPRTSHLVGMVMVDAVTDETVAAFAGWQVVWSNDVRGQQVRAGSYEYRLRRTAAGLRIAAKKVLLHEPTIDGYFDVFAV